MKIICLSAMVSLFFAFSSWAEEVKDPFPVTKQYYFPDVGGTYAEIPDEDREVFNRRLDASTICLNPYPHDSKCTDHKSVILNPNESKYFPIKPGLASICMTASGKVDTGPVVSISYDQHGESDPVFTIHTATDVCNGSLIIATSSFTDFNLITEISPEEIKTISDQSELARYKQFIVNYYRTNPPDDNMAQALRWSYQDELNNSVEVFPLDMQISRIEETMKVTGRSFHLKSLSPFIVLELSARDEERDGNLGSIFVIQDNKVVYYQKPASSIHPLFKIGHLIAFHIWTCVPGSDACGDYVLVGDGRIWEEIL